MTGTVYFVEAPGRGIKVGYSTNVQGRLRSLQCSSPTPLKVLATIDGTIQVEQRIHALLNDHRLSGEWFADVPAVRAMIERLTSYGIGILGEMPPNPRDKLRPSSKVLAARLAEMASFYGDTTLRRLLDWEKPGSMSRLDRIARGISDPHEHEIEDIRFAYAYYAVEKIEFDRKEARRLAIELDLFLHNFETKNAPLSLTRVERLLARMEQAKTEQEALQ